MMQLFNAPRFNQLNDQMQFIAEIDKAKHVLRQTKLSDGSRRENDAEHSWHLCVMALLLEEYAKEPVDINHVIKMLLVHDIVEIDAGDTFAYDDFGQRDKQEREQKAAERLFSMLPPNQASAMRHLWEEFEARETPEARFAAAIDRLQPMLLNFLSEGFAWKKFDITADRVFDRNEQIKDGSKQLWEYAQQIIEESVNRGYLKS